jgi:hypothetical protein
VAIGVETRTKEEPGQGRTRGGRAPLAIDGRRKAVPASASVGRNAEDPRNMIVSWAGGDLVWDSRAVGGPSMGKIIGNGGGALRFLGLAGGD